MSNETKEQIAEERDRLRGEVADLRKRLSSAGVNPAVGRAAVPQHVFVLSEGDRLELEQRGVVNIGGRLMTKDDVEAEIARADNPDGNNDQSGVEIGEPHGEAAKRAAAAAAQQAVDRGPGIRGVDFVYPSVEAGKIDPAVAGTPGISGPPADESTPARTDAV